MGSEFAGYRIESVLGEGGAGIVYRAQRPAGGECALKLLGPTAAADPTLPARLKREAEYVASLSHPSLVEVYDAGTDSRGEAYVAMQYVRGVDLRARLVRGGVLDGETVHFLLSQVAGALDVAHAHGVIHRDVKAANVLIADDGWPRSRAFIADFGFAKNPRGDSVALTLTGTFVGTPGYTAPETVRAEPFDQRADVYSLACVLYECLAGDPPLIRGSGLQSLEAHAKAPRPRITELRPDLPRLLDEVIARGMAISPDARFRRCSELLEAFGDALAVGGAVRRETSERATAGGEASSEPSSARSAAARFEVVAGSASGRTIIVEDELVLGRNADGAGRFPEDWEISGYHARITVDRAGFFEIEDLGSTNGTFLNGLRLTAPQTLSEEDTIELGGTELLVRELPAPTAREVSIAPAGRDLSVELARVEPAEEAQPSLPALALRIDIDFALRTVTIDLEDGSIPLRIVHDADRWRIEPGNRATGG